MAPHNAGLCLLCDSINIGSLTHTEGHAHHQNLRDLRRSASTCQLCALLLASLLSSTANVYGDLDKEETQQCHRVVLRWPYPLGTKNSVAIDLLPAEATAKLKVSRAGVTVFTDEHDPAVAHEVPWRRSIPSSTRSKESAIRASLWLRECTEEHGKSEQKDNKVGPYQAARLLEITDHHVKIVPGCRVRAPYASLSYAWGEGPWPWRTEKANLAQRMSAGLDICELPRTIADAVAVTRSLGLSHLWVDALCIVQGDMQDWAAESIKMAAIYSESFVNIAASSSTSSRSGLYNVESRSQHHRFSACIAAHSVLENEQPSSLYFYDRTGLTGKRDLRDIPSEDWDYPDAFHDEVETGPLAQRAWVCQERISSPRTIHYGSTQLFWQCTHKIDTEDHLGSLRATSGDSMWRSFFFPPGLEEQWAVYDRREDGINPEEVDRLWSSFVVAKHYSHRQTTYASDRLVAIAGLAKHIWLQNRSMRYLAGLWDVKLLDGLMWSATGPGYRIPDYVGPSWSWASRLGRAEYGVMGTANAQFDCKVIHYSIEHATSDQFSPVRSAVLVLEADMVHGTTSWHRPHSSSEEAELLLENGAKGLAVLDDDSINDVEVSALLIRRDWLGTYFLLVVPHPSQQDMFERIGIASFVPSYRAEGNTAHDFEGLLRRQWQLI
jgi:hypothetical protein